MSDEEWAEVKLQGEQFLVSQARGLELKACAKGVFDELVCCYTPPTTCCSHGVMNACACVRTRMREGGTVHIRAGGRVRMWAGESNGSPGHFSRGDRGGRPGQRQQANSEVSCTKTTFSTAHGEGA